MNTLEYSKYYHIYNRGNNREDLFKTEENHHYFLQLYEKYISPVADTYAWVLMRNHFHFLVRIKEEKEIDYLPPIDPSRSGDPGRFTPTPRQTFHGPQDMEASGLRKRKKPLPSHQFAHLFNAYTKYFNRLFQRTGSLFEKNFKHIEIVSENYFRQVVIYIHNNPVHHKITDNYACYPWSGYQSLFSSQPSIIKREQVIEWFGDRENLIFLHNQKMEIERMKDLLLE